MTATTILTQKQWIDTIPTKTNKERSKRTKLVLTFLEKWHLHNILLLVTCLNFKFKVDYLYLYVNAERKRMLRLRITFKLRNLKTSSDRLQRSRFVNYLLAFAFLLSRQWKKDTNSSLLPWFQTVKCISWITQKPVVRTTCTCM